MTRRTVILLSGLLLLFGCSQSADKRYSKVVNTYFDQWFQIRPVKATWAGLHDYDDRLNDYTADGIARAQELYSSTLDKLGGIHSTRLARQNEIDYQIFQEALENELFNSQDIQRYKRDPGMYMESVGQGLQLLADQPSAPDSVRALNYTSRLRQIPNFFSVARQNLTNVSSVALDAAIPQARGLASLIKSGSLHAGFSGLPAAQLRSIENAEQSAAETVSGFANWLNTDARQMASGDFRLGKDLYDQKFGHVLNLTRTPDEILDQAEVAIKNLQDSMYVQASQLAREWWNTGYRAPSHRQQLNLIHRVIDRISREHPDEDQLNSYLLGQILQLEQFVDQHNLITLESKRSIQIRSMPSWYPDYQIAGLNMVGPMNLRSSAFLDFKQVPSEWSNTQKESYLREYNDYALQLVAAHYGIPGKSVQQYYADRYPSLVRNVYASLVMQNGWAAYVEQMIVADGWEDASPEMRLIQLKRALEWAIDASLDQRVHTREMPRDAALRLMTVEGFQEQTAAALNWQQIQLNPVTVSTYFIGKDEILSLRDAFRAVNPADFSLLDFHKRLLGYGLPPIKFLRQLFMEGAY